MNTQAMNKEMPQGEATVFHRQKLYTIGAIAAILAMLVSVSDVVLGFGATEVVINGTRSAGEWFAVYQESPFDGLYSLGILNIVYMIAMLPVYFALLWAHRRRQGVQAALAMTIFLLATSIYISTNAAIPLLVLSNKYALATTDIQKTILIAAGESILARGEDFTPGTFISLLLGSSAAIAISMVMLRGGIFGRRNAWIGIVGFTCLLLFTVVATFVPALYTIAFYGFASIGGILALTWFALVARRLYQLGKSEE